MFIYIISGNTMQMPREDQALFSGCVICIGYISNQIYFVFQLRSNSKSLDGNVCSSKIFFEAEIKLMKTFSCK